MELPTMKYEMTGLEPALSSEVLEFHYGKHFNGYINNVNRLTDNKVTFDNLLETIMTAEGGLFNNAAQVFNHKFYFEGMTGDKARKEEPTGALMEMIVRDFGSFEEFKALFSKAAATHFGSGWAWLVEKAGKLEIVTTHDAGHPVREGLGKPILTCDVWEHAYYVDYHNARAEYIKNWWSVVDWEVAEAQL
eukprot:TRINITY_DN965_c0_g2_i1.p1 TRINITY_DN965_c0_g2~~TRINITY_DN965_c0_g2_i1.p1  ORF type:complete len:191 (+),score=47.40 TRINITY_DN965_c0_g2_i1:59-631(+)